MSLGKRVLGVDHSSQVLAFSMCVDGKIEYWEEIKLTGKNVYERVGDLFNKLRDRFDSEVIDIVVIEKTARVNSLDTAIKMGFVAGCIIGYFASKNIQIFECPALSWQAFTAKPTLSKMDKIVLQRDNPGRAKSWYTNEGRKIRKQRIMDWVKSTFGIEAPSDASDAICISYYGSMKIG